MKAGKVLETYQHTKFWEVIDDMPAMLRATES
jgi:hypothetical protein